MLTPQMTAPREGRPRAMESVAPMDLAVWQHILSAVRTQHPSLNRLWFDQLTPRSFANGVIQIATQTPAQLSFCQSQCQQPFTQAAQAVTGRLVAVTFACDNVPTGGVFNEGDQP